MLRSLLCFGERRRRALISELTLGLLSVVAVTLTFFGGSSRAWAQLSAQQKQEVRQHYEKATRAYDIGKYDEAIAEYQNVYEISGDSKMLYNIGQAYRLNGQADQAVRFYRRYLQRLPNAANREDVEKKIADQEKALEEQRVAAAAAAAAAASPAPPPPTLAPPPPVSTLPAPAPVPPPIESSYSPSVRIASYVFLAAGTAGLGFAGVSGLIAKNKSDQLSKDSKSGAVFDPNIESQGKLWNKLFFASVIGGGALFLTGGVLFLASGSPATEHAEAERRSRFVALPVIGPEGAGLAGAFVF